MVAGDRFDVGAGPLGPGGLLRFPFRPPHEEDDGEGREEEHGDLIDPSQVGEDGEALHVLTIVAVGELRQLPRG